MIEIYLDIWRLSSISQPETVRLDIYEIILGQCVRINDSGDKEQTLKKLDVICKYEQWIP